MSSQGWGCSSMVEGLPSMCEALDLIPSTTKAKKTIFSERKNRKKGRAAEEKEEEKQGKEKRKSKG